MFTASFHFQSFPAGVCLQVRLAETWGQDFTDYDAMRNTMLETEEGDEVI